jgi:hypothetical protein
MRTDGREWINGLPDELDGQRAIMLALLDWCEADQRARCLVVACSVGRGAADRLSDLDLGLLLDVEDADFDEAVADVRRAVDAASELVASYHHKLPNVAFRHERIFAQYANRCQVDLVVIALAEEYGGVRDEVVLYDPDGRRQRVAAFVQQPVSAAQAREWAFNGWACLADVGKYLRRGSAWEALERLHQARAEYWRLLATACDVPNPQFGITSLLDFAPERVPAELSATVSDLHPGGLLSAARGLAGELAKVGDRLKPELSAALPDAMADYIVSDLAAIKDPQN